MFARGCASSALVALAWAGCVGTPTPSERAARADLALIAGQVQPDGAVPDLPRLTADSGLADFLRFAVLNNPRVRSAYFQWAAAVERITPARSRPDPMLAFSADIGDMVMALMAGLMQDFPGPGKLRLMGEGMAAESRVRYFDFEREILRAALAVKTAYYRLHFLDASIRVEKETLRLVRDLESLAEQQNAAGRATLQDVLRAKIAVDQIGIEIENLEDSRTPLLAEFKSALGLGPSDAPPPAPMRFEASRDEPEPDSLLDTALRRNPGLRAMQEDVRRAEASLALARKSRAPDFSLGIEADFKADPTLYRPSGRMSLPLWRDKLSAEIAAAQAEKRAAEARLSAEQVEIAAELASMLFMYREATRNDALLRDKLQPKARQTLEAARVGYVNGRASFLDVIDAQRMLLAFERAGIEARTQRELSLASLSLSLAGIPPEGAPVLEGGPGRPASDRRKETRP